MLDLFYDTHLTELGGLLLMLMRHGGWMLIARVSNDYRDQDFSDILICELMRSGVTHANVV